MLVRRELVEVLVDRLRRLDLVADAVDPGQQHRREGEVGIGRRVGAAELDALSLGVRPRDRDADRRGTVPLAVDEVHRRLEPRHEPVVGVDRRVGERQQRRRVLEEPADVVAGQVREPGVPGLVVEERLAAVPDRLVAVHSGAVVAEDRLRHEGRGLAVAPGDVLHHVLELHHGVGGLQQLVEAPVDLRLARRTDLVVRPLDDETGALELDDDLVAEVAEVVVRRDREVAALVLHLVAAVVELRAAVPRAGLGVDVVEARVGVGLEPHVVEDVELRLGRKVRGVADSCRLQVGLGLPRDVARVAAVGLTGERVVDEEVDDERLARAERVEVRRGRVWEQRHVRLVDRLEPADRGAVEVETVVEDRLAERRHRDREVLHDPRQVAEPDVDHLDALVLDVLQQLVAVREHGSSLADGRGRCVWSEAVRARCCAAPP